MLTELLEYAVGCGTLELETGLEEYGFGTGKVEDELEYAVGPGTLEDEFAEYVVVRLMLGVEYTGAECV